ncbi:UDP-2,3-diacylglucosamine diphosphatase LpxI [Aliiroseovarius sp. KMU-50]|uniref:UDP-2,3-diacylglucosamine diphosphatase LpxI n=1 Tax=Aliiroseovarius salicola TaxID=3009082 RepID=A0ABT4W2Y1_9RHOB|nr:UDP-2,3-diacylglucosamine diphosphatase LpxI [Aliiroseovarius sp. KMU-50]MDA5094875.1 UDP-2,3-diacylglucosamine diphosphatase LpxI [Aliiroseovarius sp. KMU-50]
MTETSGSVATSGRLAIIAGSGHLPGAIATANPEALFVALKGIEVIRPKTHEYIEASYEKLGALFKTLHKSGVTRVTFVGNVTRPKLNPLKMDMTTMSLFPRIKSVLGKGDDAVLRLVAEVFEEQGFEVVSAKDVSAGLTIEAKTIGCAMSAQDHADAERGFAILAALDDLDIAQGAVVAGGQCLGIETIRGTDALLAYVTETPKDLKQGAPGVFVKCPKRNQDARMDIPTIGPETVRNVAKAGLGGIVIPAGQVIVLDQPEVERLVSKLGLFLEMRK